MFLSIIIPVRNDLKRLKTCVNSLINQDYLADDFEIIIVDDPETNDGTKEWVEALNFKNLIYHVHEPNIKLPAKRNVGGDLASGKYIYNIDSDMEFPAGVLAKIVSEIKETKADFVVVSETTPGTAWIDRMKSYEKDLIADNIFLCAARIYKRELFNKLGGYDVNMVVGEEVDLSDKAVVKGYKYHFTEAVIYHYETSGSSLINHLKKKIRYGKSVREYFQGAQKHSKAQENKRATSSRLQYFFHKNLYKKPFTHFQFLIMKSLEMGCYAIDLILSYFKSPSNLTSLDIFFYYICLV